MTQQDEHGKPWYIHDQGWKVLIAAGDPRPWLRPEDMRPGRHRDTAGEADRATKWQHLQPQLLNEAGDGRLCRDDVLLNTGRITNENGTALDFRLLVITSDAGIGKSDTAKWIEYRLSQIKHPPYSAHAELVFRFKIRVLQERWREDRGNSDGERLLAVLQEHFEERLRGEGVQFNAVHVFRYLRDVLRRGQMCFVLDGLDQVGDDEVSLLQRLLNSSECGRSRFIIAGRPNAVLSERRWRDLFAKRGWTWVQVEDFSRRQQVRYLGWLEDGSLRYTAIDRKARDLFSIPRVLSYLRNRSASELSSLKTASAVYASAIDHLLAEGVRQTLKEGEQVNNQQLNGLKGLLAIAAYEGVSYFQSRDGGSFGMWHKQRQKGQNITQWPSRPETEPADYEYNIGSEDGFEEVLGRIKQRYQELRLYGEFDEQWSLLAELNSRFLDQGLFDDERTGLDQIVWSNRSIHEFCLANYFAERARLDEEYLLWDWIYIADQSSTDKYYQFWQFLCEMPKKRRNPTTWLRAVGMLYQRSIVSAAAESSAATSSLRYAKRSNEMIYRSWSDLQAYQTDRAADVRTKATQILKTWQSEFEETCIGDENLGVIASEQIADFLQVQPTVSRDHPFRMGTTADRQIPAEWRQLCRSTYLEYLADGSALTRHYDEHYLGRTGENLRAVQEPLVRAALSAKDETGFYQAYFSLHNSVEFSVKDLPEFCVSRRSVSNSAYRLFDPTWGETSRFGDRYSEVSGTPESPAIYLSFYDSWVYSRWLRTDEYEFRLLYEDEWEYCAKLGFSDSEWWHDFWFDESYDESQHKELLNSEERGLGRVLPAVECVSSLGSKAIDSTGVGLLGFQGNHWVWCEDIYRLQYVGRNVTDSEACDAGSSRVLRGGSWGYDAVSCRCSSRLSNGPAFQSLDAGCRLVRFS